jgi:chromosome segregation ATPase
MSNDKPLNRHEAKLSDRCNNLINQIKKLARSNKELRDIAKHPHRKPQLTAIIDHTRHKIESVSRDLSQLKRAYYSYHKPVKK